MNIFKYLLTWGFYGFCGGVICFALWQEVFNAIPMEAFK